MDKISKKLTIKYAFLQGSYWVGQCIIYSFAAVYLQHKNFNNTHIGIVLSLSAIISIILQPMVSAFADKFKKKSVRGIILTLMAIVLAFAILLFISANSFLITGGVFVIINAIQFTLNPLLNSFALEYLNNGYSFNFGLARGSGSIAFAISSFLLGHGVSKFGPGILIPLFILSYGLFFLAAYSFKLKDTNIPKPSTSNNTISPGVDNSENAPASIIGFFTKYKKFTFFLIGIAMVFYSHGLINTYLINIIENVGGNSSDMGLSLTIAAALELPMMASFVIIINKIKCNNIIKISAFFFFIKTAIIWLASNVFFVHLSMAFQMLSFALFTPASVYYVNSIINKEDRVKGQSMLGTATLGVAGTIAYITGGKVLDTSGVSNMLMLGTIVSLIGFIVIMFSTEESEV